MTELAPPAVIIVDDDTEIVQLVVEALEEVGMSTLGCTNASEAFWFIGRYQPKLIILDVQMPGVDGIQLFEQLRADPMLAHTEVMFLTANGEFLRQALPDYAQRGASLVVKPFNLNDLVAQVAAMLSEN